MRCIHIRFDVVSCPASSCSWACTQGGSIAKPSQYIRYHCRRCLLAGANGAGKTTLLEVIAGKHMVGRDAVRILGRPAFYDLMLVTSGELGYLGNQWRRSVACVGSDISMQADLSAEAMICGVDGVTPERRAMLVELLDIDLSW